MGYFICVKEIINNRKCPLVRIHLSYWLISAKKERTDYLYMKLTCLNDTYRDYSRTILCVEWRFGKAGRKFRLKIYRLFGWREETHIWFMIGVILRSLRIEAGLSAIQVADRLHISESTYRNELYVILLGQRMETCGRSERLWWLCFFRASACRRLVFDEKFCTGKRNLF